MVNAVYDLLPDEVKRIVTDAARGWVATPAELRAHQCWPRTEHAALLAGAGGQGGPDGGAAGSAGSAAADRFLP